MVVHAYSDVVYDRSSFHLAGNPSPVTAVACKMITQAIEELSVTNTYEEKDETVSRHPFVGIVDHVSVMPLDDGSDEVSGINRANDNGKHDDTCSSMGRATQDIGHVMTELGVDVHYYGDADRNKTSLATVRREQTSFFRSGSLNDSLSENNKQKAGIATVGAPPSFVENFNVRLQSDRATARSLTKSLRERDGGLLGVEALTLPYGQGRYEVACNLLRPDVGSAEAIVAKLKEWQSQQGSQDVVVEKAYRVGTTANQCQKAISLSDSKEAALEHDKDVLQRLTEYLTDGA